MEGIKFLQNFGTITGETDSLNNQLNSVQYIIALLKREVAVADMQERQMEEVSNAEEKLLYQRDLMVRDSERLVVGDIKEQMKTGNAEISRSDAVLTKQKFVHTSLTEKQSQVISKMTARADELARERAKLRKEREDLQNEVRQAKKENQDRKNQNLHLEQQIGQLNLKINVMEDNLDKIVIENT